MTRETWDVQYYDPDTGAAWRIAVKALTVRDGIAVDSAQDAISRSSMSDRELIRMLAYPLLKHGTRLVQRAMLDDAPPVDDAGNVVLPAGANWYDVDLTEDVYNDLPEWLFAVWQTYILDRNPHREPVYDALKKSVLKALQARRSMTGTNENAPPDSTHETI